MGNGGDKEVCIIFKNSCSYYKNHPKECSFHNWIAKMIAYLDFGKKVWPEPNEKEVEAFRSVTGYKSKDWGKRC